MDLSWVLNQILQFIDPLTMFLVLLLMEIIRRLIPGEGREVPSWVNRILPFVSLFLGAIVIVILHLAAFNQDPHAKLVIKGIVTGAVASYSYRTFKVTILGD